MGPEDLFQEIVKSGKVRHVGLSEFSPDWVRKLHAIHPAPRRADSKGWGGRWGGRWGVGRAGGGWGWGVGLGGGAAGGRFRV